MYILDTFISNTNLNFCHRETNIQRKSMQMENIGFLIEISWFQFIIFGFTTQHRVHII